MLSISSKMQRPFFASNSNRWAWITAFTLLPKPATFSGETISASSTSVRTVSGPVIECIPVASEILGAYTAYPRAWVPRAILTIERGLPESNYSSIV